MTDILLGSGVFTAIIVGLALAVMGARALLLPATPAAVTVNRSHTIATRAGLKLLDIMVTAGIPVPSPCGGAGRCGQCRVTIQGGGGAILSTEANLLSARDLRAGTRLACQVVVRNDLGVEVPEELFGVEQWTCIVASNRSLAAFIKELVLRLPRGVSFNFEAGSYVALTAPPYSLDFQTIDIDADYQPQWDKHRLREMKVASDQPVIRAYSLANRPSDEGLVFNIRLALPPPQVRGAPPGIVSSYLFALKQGDSIEAAGPYGTFRAQETDREMIFIGGGVGMAPLRAIIADQLERRGTKRKISFWYGARDEADLFYADEMASLASRHDNFTWTPALSDPAPGGTWRGATGFVHHVVYERYLSDHPAPEECEYYLCGPPLMIKAVFTMLDDLGVERESIYFDDFGS